MSLYGVGISGPLGKDQPADREAAEAVTSALGFLLVDEEDPAGIGLWLVAINPEAEAVLHEDGFLDLVVDGKGRLQVEMP